ncbi:MAG TPA: permease [Chitinophagaceae bacterium]|nr:permease [Chitinophagaceae bacterium]
MIVKLFFSVLFKMSWDIYWPLALGFMLSAWVRSFIPTSAISRRLGKSDIKGLSFAAIMGALSSSCSYAAASMGRTLIIKGSSWSNAVAFMIASTNLVFEIFLVIVTLLGWEFFGGEIVGGLLFILIGAILIKLIFSKKIEEKAKAHIHSKESALKKADPHAHHAKMNMDTEKNPETLPPDHHPGHAGGTYGSNSLIKDAAQYFYMDVIMVGKDILLGIIISSLLAIGVPSHFWVSLFLKNDAQLPQLTIVIWNAFVGILIGIFAFVCSVGNILLAAVLWYGGINFGGVIAFILSDLVTIPMLLVYRRYYGLKIMWRLLILLSLSILITGVGVDYLFQWFHWVPHHPSINESFSLWMPGFHWDYNAFLNIFFIPVSISFFLWGKKVMKRGMKA